MVTLVWLFCLTSKEQMVHIYISNYLKNVFVTVLMLKTEDHINLWRASKDPQLQVIRSIQFQISSYPQRRLSESWEGNAAIVLEASRLVGIYLSGRAAGGSMGRVLVIKEVILFSGIDFLSYFSQVTRFLLLFYFSFCISEKSDVNWHEQS